MLLSQIIIGVDVLVSVFVLHYKTIDQKIVMSDHSMLHMKVVMKGISDAKNKKTKLIVNTKNTNPLANCNRTLN